jgi:predicted nucleotidyltransferase
VFGDRLREIRLFGSYARGDADEESDVDVLVVVDGLTDLEIGVVATESVPVMLAHHIDLSPLPMSTSRLDELRRSERLLARTLDEEGVRL